MKPNSVSNADLPELSFGTAGTTPPKEGQGFDKALQAASSEHSGQKLMSEPQPIIQPGLEIRSEAPPNSALPTPQTVKPAPPSGAKVAATYRQAMQNAGASNGVSTAQAKAAPSAEPAPMSDFAKYKDDQLLRNPGGRNYYLDEKKVVENSPDQQSFLGRLGKTVSAVGGNIRNFAGNIFMGSKFLYRGEKNEIKEASTRGFIGSAVSFFKDLGSALSFGAYHPDMAATPQGFWERTVYSAKKLRDAIQGDLMEGIPSSVNNMGKNLVLAGLHLVQVLPDATIGNFDAGRKLTTSIFDNGHLMVEYISDVVPSGDAWLRVHASNLSEFQVPLLYNIKMPEQFSGDARWQHVRNTPFRKTIETLGSLMADAAGIYLISQAGSTSNRQPPVE